MSDPQQHLALFHDLEAALRALGDATARGLDAAHLAIVRVSDDLAAEADRLTAALNHTEDPDEAAALADRLDELRHLARALAAAALTFSHAAVPARAVAGEAIPAAIAWLGDRADALARFETGPLGLAGAAAGAAAPAARSHGAPYQKAQQAFLRGVPADPQLPAYARGWIRNQINRLERTRRARATGQRPPGGNPRRIRGIPGLDVGHRFPGVDLPKSFRLENPDMNSLHYQVARRLGLDRSYR